MIILDQLPKDDLLRNIPLKDLNAECRNKDSQNWRRVGAWKIGRNSYNELGEVWTELSEFRVPDLTTVSEDGRIGS